MNFNSINNASIVQATTKKRVIDRQKMESLWKCPTLSKSIQVSIQNCFKTSLFLDRMEFEIDIWGKKTFFSWGENKRWYLFNKSLSSFIGLALIWSSLWRTIDVFNRSLYVSWSQTDFLSKEDWINTHTRIALSRSKGERERERERDRERERAKEAKWK